MPHERFEWDSRKAQENVAKHGSTFEEAAAVLADPVAQRNHITLFDGPHSNQEDRWKTFGTYPYDPPKIFLVVWTLRADEDGLSVTRIISARPATSFERKAYQHETAGI